MWRHLRADSGHVDDWLDSHTVGVANIPEAIPEDQAHAPAYQGVLQTNIPTAEILALDTERDERQVAPRF